LQLTAEGLLGGEDRARAGPERPVVEEDRARVQGPALRQRRPRHGVLAAHAGARLATRGTRARRRFGTSAKTPLATRSMAPMIASVTPPFVRSMSAPPANDPIGMNPTEIDRAVLPIRPSIASGERAVRNV